VTEGHKNFDTLHPTVTSTTATLASVKFDTPTTKPTQDRTHHSKSESTTLSSLSVCGTALTGVRPMSNPSRAPAKTKGASQSKAH